MTPDRDDRSHLAVARWTAALPAERYDLRLVPDDSDEASRVACRRFDAAALLHALPWLRARNAGGWHVYCRPMDARHVLVDDLDPDGLDALVRTHEPAAVVETSPHCFQAWITVSPAAPPIGLANAAARLLVRRYGGDAGAASAVQLGRLPGTTNRKPRHERGDGSHPFALLRRARAGLDPGGAGLLTEAEALLTAERPLDAAEAAGGGGEGSGGPPPAWARGEAAEAARRVRAGLASGACLDRSRLDFAAARRVLARGGTWRDATAVVLAGDRARRMPPGAALAYAERTAAAAGRAVAEATAGPVLRP